jgi:hypothetical protein
MIAEALLPLLPHRTPRPGAPLGQTLLRRAVHRRIVPQTERKEFDTVVACAKDEAQSRTVVCMRRREFAAAPALERMIELYAVGGRPEQSASELMANRVDIAGKCRIVVSMRETKLNQIVFEMTRPHVNWRGREQGIKAFLSGGGQRQLRSPRRISPRGCGRSQAVLPSSAGAHRRLQASGPR